MIKNFRIKAWKEIELSVRALIDIKVASRGHMTYEAAIFDDSTHELSKIRLYVIFVKKYEPISHLWR